MKWHHMGPNVLMYVCILDDISLKYMTQIRKIMKDGKAHIKQTTFEVLCPWECKNHYTNFQNPTWEEENYDSHVL